MTTTDHRTQAEKDAAQRFARETAKHQMTVMQDGGLYRTLRFANSDSSLYWYEITTTPGQLVFSGDGDSFVFRLAPDMFDMFRSSYQGGDLNIGYWAERCRTSNAKSYSRELFAQYVEKQVADAEPYYPGLREDVECEVFENDNVDREPDAVRAAATYAYFLDHDKNPERRPAFCFHYVHDWDLQDYDWWFLFACHAIRAGIGQYDAAKAAKAVAR
jgi:hypothetical protein